MFEYTVGFLVGASAGVAGYYFLPKIWNKVKAWLVLKLS